MVELVLIAEGADESALKELSSGLRECIPPDSLKIVSSEGFTGLRGLTAIFGIGGVAVLNALSGVIFAWVNKHKHCKVKINGIEISGYSAQDTLKLLKRALDERQSSA